MFVVLNKTTTKNDSLYKPYKQQLNKGNRNVCIESINKLKNRNYDFDYNNRKPTYGTI